MKILLLAWMLVGSAAWADLSENRVTILDSRRNPYSISNPLPVTSVNNPVGSTTIRQSNTTANLASNATTNHDYTNGGSTNERVKQVQASSSGLIKVIFKVGSTCAGATDIGFTSFNQTGENIRYSPLADLDLLPSYCLRITILNREADPQDVYSTVEAVQLP